MQFDLRIISLFVVAFSICSASLAQGGFREDTQSRSNGTSETPSAPDYSVIDYWASHPSIHDRGDSIPKPLRKYYTYDSTVDVFFIHPTTYIRKENGQMNADLHSDAVNNRTDQRTILNQASAFNEYRLFAPRYRQVNYSAYMNIFGGNQPIFDTAYADVKNAFQYYLRHWNRGRPFFIASHSQGTQHAVRLIKELIEGTALEKKLITAYIIGTPPIKTGKLKIPVCNDSSKTGCYVAWNTFTEEFRRQFDFLGRADLETVNPLTWTTSESKAPGNLHKGAVVQDFNSVKPQALSALIRSGKLVVDTEDNSVDLPGSLQNLHVLDINLFYVDIRSNLRTRVAAYKKRNSM